MSTQATAEDVIKRIRQRYDAGEPMPSIARNEKVSVTTVKKHTRDLPRRKSGNRLNPATLAEVKELSGQDLTQEAIALKLGINAATVRRYQRALGITPRPQGRARKTAADLTR